MKARLARIVLLIACALVACAPSVAFASVNAAEEPEITLSDAAMTSDCESADHADAEDESARSTEGEDGSLSEDDSSAEGLIECDPIKSSDLESGSCDSTPEPETGLPECDPVETGVPETDSGLSGESGQIPGCAPIQSGDLSDSPSGSEPAAPDDPRDPDQPAGENDGGQSGEGAGDAVGSEPVSLFVGAGGLANGNNLVDLVNKAKLVANIDAVVLNAETNTRQVEESEARPLEQATADVRAALKSNDVAVIYTGAKTESEQETAETPEVVRGPVSIGGAYLYSVGGDDMGDAESANSAAGAFSEWAGSLNETKENAPIVIVLDKGIHECDSDSESASVWLNTINSVAESVPVIVAYTKSQDTSSGNAVADIVMPGESVPSSDDSQSTEIKFTYMNVGNVEEGSGSLLSIARNTVTVNRIGVNGWIDTQEISLVDEGTGASDEGDPSETPDRPGDSEDPSDAEENEPSDESAKPDDDTGVSGASEKPEHQRSLGDENQADKPGRSDKDDKRDKNGSENRRSVGAVAYADPEEPSSFEGGDSGNDAGKSAASKRTNKLFDPVPENEEVPVKNMVDEMLGKTETDGAAAPAEKDRSAFPAALLIVLLSGVATLAACKKLYRAA